MTEDQRRYTGPAAGSAHCREDAAYVLGSLSPADRQSYESHLSTCARCRASVGRLAGLPGLLAGTSPADIGLPTTPLPHTLLPRLLTAVARERRRRVAWSGLAGAAAAAMIVLVVMLLVWPTSPGQPAQSAQQAQKAQQTQQSQQTQQAPVRMQSLVAAPLDVSLQLTDKQWGTSVIVHCADEGHSAASEGYQLVAFDPAGKPQTLGSWTSVAGASTTVTTATSLHVKDISRFEVQLPDGKPLLSAVPANR